jgi:hypothetical protein
MNKGFTKLKWRFNMRKVVTLFVCITGIAVAVAQNSDYTTSIARLYAAGQTGLFARDWCVDRVPKSAPSASLSYENWRKAQGIPEIEVRFKALMGDKFAGVAAKLEEARPNLYQSLDQNITNPEGTCMKLGDFYSQNFNLRTAYASDYQVMATRALPNAQPSISSKPLTTQPAPQLAPQPSINSSSLPKIPVYNPVQLAQMGIDPESEPIPDEYYCYAKSKTDQYAQPTLTLQILPKRQYRVAGGTGAFRVEKDDIFFTSGSLASKEDHYFNFKRQFGGYIWLYNIGANETDYRCHQRGSANSLAQLEFKRKDPAIGTYTCVTKSGNNIETGKLEILANRQYKFNNVIGQIKVDILGDQSDDYSSVDFVGGAWDDENAFYEEDEYGQQVWSVYANPKQDCVRLSTPRPNPKFGTNAAPKPPSGTGGLEGRFYTWRIDIPIGGMYFCGGLCFDYLFFSKNGYVFTGDPETMDGTEDADCTKTYPSGFPICDTYQITNNTIRIDNGKTKSFKRTNQGLTIDGEKFEPLKPMGNIKLEGVYSHFSASGSTIGPASSFSTSVDYMFSKQGRFTRDASSSAYVSATSDGTPSGTTTAVSSSWSQRKNSGTYKTYNNTIEFTYLDGRIVKRFAFAVQDDNSYFRIGGSDYTKKK